MILKPAQLPSHLQQQLQPLYWITGDEPLLVLECADQIRQYCRQHGFQDREVFTVNTRFDWNGFMQSASNYSLFAERKLIELRFDTARLEDDGKLALQSYMASPNPDYVVMITSPRVDKTAMASKWFKTINPLVVQIWPLSPDELPAWLSQRLQQNAINASGEALQILVDKVEGNLLAAVQEIEKLKLLFGSDQGKTLSLDAETVLQVVADSSRYNAFVLIDAALAGDSRRVLKIIQGLRAEGVTPLPIVGALCNELRRLLPLLKQVQTGQSIANVIQAGKVNFKRKQALTRALQRVRPVLIYSLLDQARGVDYAIKGLSLNDPWSELENLFLRLSGVVTATSRRVG